MRGLLSNFEVRDLLRKRGADKGPLGGSITVGECKVYEFLAETPAGTQTKGNIEEFVAGVKAFNLTDAEKLQSINLRPSTAVEVHLIVEDCDERLSNSQVDRFIGTVTGTLPEPTLKPEAEAEADGEADPGPEAKFEGDEMEEFNNEAEVDEVSKDKDT
jgi:hypothetical protein